MADIRAGNQTIDSNSDLVLLLIGARVNRFWLLPFSLPILSKMQNMLSELIADPNSGLLGVQSLGMAGMVQYWKSMDHLLRYAASQQHEHRPTAKKYYQKIFKNQAVGVWHECFFVRAGHYEAFYSNMPAFGMGRFKNVVPATGARATARKRLAAYFQGGN